MNTFVNWLHIWPGFQYMYLYEYYLKQCNYFKPFATKWRPAGFFCSDEITFLDIFDVFLVVFVICSQYLTIFCYIW
jgi:hypothetical protein